MAAEPCELHSSPPLLANPNRFDGRALRSRAAGAGGVAVRHDVNAGCPPALRAGRHPGANLADEPIAGSRRPVSIAPPPTMSASGSKVLIISSKNSPSACAWTRKMSRHIASPRSASPRTFLAASADVQRRQLVAGVPREKIRQQRAADGGQRAQRLEIADAPAVAVGPDALDPGDALIRDQHVTAARRRIPCAPSRPRRRRSRRRRARCRRSRRSTSPAPIPKIAKWPHSAPALPSLR